MKDMSSISASEQYALDEYEADAGSHKRLVALILTLTLVVGLIWSHVPIPETRASSTVMVKIPNGHGSGVYLGHGYVLTVAHVAGQGQSLRVKTNKGDTYDATLLWSNEAYDVALLQIPNRDNPIVPAKLACRTPKTGEEITAGGNPLGITFVNTYGRVSGPPRTWSDTKWVSPASYTVIPGMSGGPVYDHFGMVLGLNDMVTLQPLSFEAAPVGLGWFVPAKVACLLMMKGA